MNKFWILIAAFFLVTGPNVARAEPVPDYALEKDYENCMGGDTEQTNSERARFCGCAREKMKGWDIDTYGTAATEQAKNPTDTTKVAEKIGEIAKDCLSQAFK